MKRLFDVCVSGAALLILSPVLAAIGIAVRIADGGPAFYNAPRLGRSGRTFTMLKFRTMAVGAPDLRNSDGSTRSEAADPRLTPLGGWLRRTSLDELPQLWNVLRGDMSLVGPRPELPDQITYYSAADMGRLTVRPGITGLAQISGRNDISWKERRALDLQYVSEQSFLTDLAILARTVPGVLRGRGVATTKPDGTGTP
jgi:lipopolysaccharide/colanic/teichoic acid biosynthesis glycosyltransferase